MTKYALKTLTSVEFRERLADDPVVLIPLGSQEPQGPQSPLGDFMLSERLAELVGARSGAIVAPTTPFGYADIFRGVPGGIQLRPATFLAFLEDIITSFLDHGISRLLIFNGHTGNNALIHQTIHKMRREHGLLVPALHFWHVPPPSVYEPFYSGKGPTTGGHGGDPITSVYMHLFPELVRGDLVAPATAKTIFGRPANMGGFFFEGRAVDLPLDVTEVGELGMAGGDGTRSSAALGAAITEYIVEHTTKLVGFLRTIDPFQLESEAADVVEAAGARP